MVQENVCKGISHKLSPKGETHNGRKEGSLRQSPSTNISGQEVQILVDRAV